MGKLAIGDGPSRRDGIKAGAAALASALPMPALAQAEPTLRIGFLTVNTGPLAAGGKQQEEGVALFLKEGESGSALGGERRVVKW